MQTAQQVIKPTFVDSSDVKPAYSNGPTNLTIIGPCGTLTFTNVTQPASDLFAGKQTGHIAVVSAKVTMPLEGIVGLRDLLNRMIAEHPIAPGSNLKQ